MALRAVLPLGAIGLGSRVPTEVLFLFPVGRARSPCLRVGQVHILSHQECRDRIPFPCYQEVRTPFPHSSGERLPFLDAMGKRFPGLRIHEGRILFRLLRLECILSPGLSIPIETGRTRHELETVGSAKSERPSFSLFERGCWPAFSSVIGMAAVGGDRVFGRGQEGSRSHVSVRMCVHM